MRVTKAATLELDDAELKALKHVAAIAALEIVEQRTEGSHEPGYARQFLKLDFSDMRAAQALAREIEGL